MTGPTTSGGDVTLRAVTAAVIALVLVSLAFAVGIGIVNFQRIGV